MRLILSCVRSLFVMACLSYPVAAKADAQPIPVPEFPQTANLPAPINSVTLPSFTGTERLWYKVAHQHLCFLLPKDKVDSFVATYTTHGSLVVLKANTSKSVLGPVYIVCFNQLDKTMLRVAKLTCANPTDSVWRIGGGSYGPAYWPRYGVYVCSKEKPVLPPRSNVQEAVDQPQSASQAGESEPAPTE